MNARHVAIVVIALSVAAPFGAQFSDAGREKHEKVDEILAALETSSGKRIADVAAGDGFYSVRIARAVGPSGRVAAVDVSEAALDKLRARLQHESVTNVDVILGAFDDPRLPANTFDAALIYNSYHEMTEHAGVLRGIFAGLKTGGRLVIIEPVHDVRRSASRAEQTAKHEISDELAAQELQTAGFHIGRRDPKFRPFTDPEGTGGWWLIVAIKPTL